MGSDWYVAGGLGKLAWYAHWSMVRSMAHRRDYIPEEIARSLGWRCYVARETWDPLLTRSWIRRRRMR